MNALENKGQPVTSEEYKLGTVYRVLEVMYLTTKRTFKYELHGEYIQLLKGDTFMLLALEKAVVAGEVRYRATCLTQGGLLGYWTADYHTSSLFKNWDREPTVEPIYIP